MIKSIKKNLLTVVGLGYVGLPLAVEFSKKMNTAGVYISKKKIRELKKGKLSSDNIDLKNFKYLKKIHLTTEASILKKSKYIIVGVPTPINQDKNPNLKPLMKACKMIGYNLTKNTYIIFESTVYPGMTEEVCIPILEKYSKLKWKRDFNVAYSPERLVPGSKTHILKNIDKLIAGDSDAVRDNVAKLYSKILISNIIKCSSIKVA